VNDLRDTCQSDRAADRAASAARTLAAIAHDAARKYVERDAVTPKSHGADIDPMARSARDGAPLGVIDSLIAVDRMERERQARLRRWHELPHPNRKGR
jgi:hypothetical protein